MDYSQLKGSFDQSRENFNSIITEGKTDSLGSSSLQTERIEIELDRFPKYPYGYSSISWLFTKRGKQRNNHLFSKKIK
ncbi:hypothetical protein EJ110_NYTH50320 [Nymphaea thermarum]|nr:hypothetical protein EJ110_NYTH50320 [Nymphaea thermarum]